ncbi:hypothetical protein BC828DRAFT_394751 [Blastocladiella britannica]|nr:hypothetical protein BC828DRAFT_394751 [Blastocladiella britannica]
MRLAGRYGRRLTDPWRRKGPPWRCIQRSLAGTRRDGQRPDRPWSGGVLPGRPHLGGAVRASPAPPPWWPRARGPEVVTIRVSQSIIPSSPSSKPKTLLLRWASSLSSSLCADDSQSWPSPLVWVARPYSDRSSSSRGSMPRAFAPTICGSRSIKVCTSVSVVAEPVSPGVEITELELAFCTHDDRHQSMFGGGG